MQRSIEGLIAEAKVLQQEQAVPAMEEIAQMELTMPERLQAFREEVPQVPTLMVRGPRVGMW